MSNKVYELITDQIISLLETGTVPWRKPWTNGPAATSYAGRSYRGINALLLSAIASQRGLKGAWITFRQAKKAGGRVKKGEKGVRVVFWKWLEAKKSAETTDDCQADKANTSKRFPMLRYYTVFSLCQTEGVPEPSWLSNQSSSEDSEQMPLEEARAIWEAFQDGPSLTHGGDRAAYSPKHDRISMPEWWQFDAPEHYWATLFHEAVHSTGHATRLKRFDTDAGALFGSESYSKEELVAEMGAAFLNAESGLDAPELLEASASYIASWVKVLNDDPKMVVMAAAQAQKAADLILRACPGEGG